MKSPLTLLFISFLFLQTKEQSLESIAKLQVLNARQIGKEFRFDLSSETPNPRLYLTYLGAVKTKAGCTYKIMNATWITTRSKRASSRILVFDEQQKSLGYYNVSTIADLPTTLENGVLHFKNRNKDCDKNIVSKINLKEGLPPTFFRECKVGLGDVYVFEKKRN